MADGAKVQGSAPRMGELFTADCWIPKWGAHTSIVSYKHISSNYWKKNIFIVLQVKHNQNNHWQNDIFIKCSKKILDYSIVGILLTVIIDSNKLATIWNTYSAFAHRFKALADGRWTESTRIGTENGRTLAYRLFSLFHAESECL